MAGQSSCRWPAAGMLAAGHEFFRAANGVWLTHRVPPAFLREMPA